MLFLRGRFLRRSDKMQEIYGFPKKNVLKNKSSCVILKSQSYSSCNETKFFIYQICLYNSEAQKDREFSKGRKTRKAG